MYVAFFFFFILQHHAAEAEYTLHGCMYNTTQRGFIGRIYDSLPFSLVENLQGGAVVCPINQVSNLMDFYYVKYKDHSTGLLFLLSH